MKLIKQTNIMKVWKATEGKFITGTDSSTACKYLIVDLRNGGSVALRTNSLIEALSFTLEETNEEIMVNALKANIVTFSRKNLNFSEIYLIEQTVASWNKAAIRFGYPEYVITGKFSRRQALANKFAEILESL